MTSEQHREGADSVPAEGTGDYLVPIGTTGSGCCRLSSSSGPQPRNEDIEAASTQTISPINTVIYIRVKGSSQVAIGCAPNGFVALLDDADWNALRGWRLTRLRVSSGSAK